MSSEKRPSYASMKRARATLARNAHEKTVLRVALEIDRSFREGWRAGKLSRKEHPPLRAPEEVTT